MHFFKQNISDRQDIFIQCIKGFTVGIEEEFFTRASHTTVTCVPPFVAILANNLHTHLNKSLMFSSYVPAYDHVRYFFVYPWQSTLGCWLQKIVMMLKQLCDTHYAAHCAQTPTSSFLIMFQCYCISNIPFEIARSVFKDFTKNAA